MWRRIRNRVAQHQNFLLLLLCCACAAFVILLLLLCCACAAFVILLLLLCCAPAAFGFRAAAAVLLLGTPAVAAFSWQQKQEKKAKKKKDEMQKKKKRFHLPSTPDLPCASSSPTRFALILPRTSASNMSPFCRHQSGGDTSLPCESPLSTIDCAQGSASQHRSTIATFGKISAWTFHHARMFTF